MVAKLRDAFRSQFRAGLNHTLIDDLSSGAVADAADAIFADAKAFLHSGR